MMAWVAECPIWKEFTKGTTNDVPHMSKIAMNESVERTIIQWAIFISQFCSLDVLNLCTFHHRVRRKELEQRVNGFML